MANSQRLPAVLFFTPEFENVLTENLRHCASDSDAAKKAFDRPLAMLMCIGHLQRPAMSGRNYPLPRKDRGACTGRPQTGVELQLLLAPRGPEISVRHLLLSLIFRKTTYHTITVSKISHSETRLTGIYSICLVVPRQRY